MKNDKRKMYKNGEPPYKIHEEENLTRFIWIILAGILSMGLVVGLLKEIFT